MRREPYRPVIRGNEAESLADMNFEKFGQRPVNYHEGQVSEPPSEPARSEPSPVSEPDLRAFVAAETARIKQEAERGLEARLKESMTRAKEEADAELQRAVQLLRQYADMLQSEKNELAARYEAEVLELAFDLAQKILGRELKEKPEFVVQIARNAVQQVIDCHKITVRTNPDDLSYLKSLREDIESQLSQDTRFELISDNSVEAGGCVIDTEKGTLDARVESQLETMKANLSASSKQP